MLLEKYLNIIMLNVPFPPDYGGMIDSFHRIRLLHDAGVGIMLHCFSYGRGRSPELESLCISVKYYRRKTGFIKQLSTVPYCVSSRISAEMVKNLADNSYPILFDGIHTTGIITNPSFSDRTKIIRMHNIEHEYYSTLAASETKIFKKLYFAVESARLKRFEKVISCADHLLSVSPYDNDYFNNKYHNSILIPSSHPFDKTEITAGSGNYIIFHGDLSVNENVEIAVFLASTVFPEIGYRCVIAGKNPPELLKNLVGKYQNIDLVANPDDFEMQRLIKDAHINILPVKRMNGLKLKLLYALFSGKHLIINSEMSKGLEKGALFHIADSSGEMKLLISRLMKQPFTLEMIKEREKFLSLWHNNKVNTNKLISLI
jgi:glycosyltransferase involved in cell wall biosynthesis